MHRTIVIETCLGLCLASHASAEPITSRSRDIAAVGARSTRPSVFSYPDGLSMSAERLFERLGQCPTHCLPMTSETTFDLAYACFIRGMYDDAIALASHGLKLRGDARLYLLKGVCEMHVGRCSEAEETAEQYLNAVNGRNTIGLAIARERVNGPMRVRFEQILKHISTT
jgi:hypothetical protein